MKIEWFFLFFFSIPDLSEYDSFSLLNLVFSFSFERIYLKFQFLLIIWLLSCSSLFTQFIFHAYFMSFSFSSVWTKHKGSSLICSISTKQQPYHQTKLVVITFYPVQKIIALAEYHVLNVYDSMSSKAIFKNK